MPACRLPVPLTLQRGIFRRELCSPPRFTKMSPMELIISSHGVNTVYLQSLRLVRKVLLPCLLRGIGRQERVFVRSTGVFAWTVKSSSRVSRGGLGPHGQSSVRSTLDFVWFVKCYFRISCGRLRRNRRSFVRFTGAFSGSVTSSRFCRRVFVLIVLCAQNFSEGAHAFVISVDLPPELSLRLP